MADEYTEITTISWGDRIVGSFMGVILGILFFIGAFPLIWWNEGHSVDRIRTLDEGRGLVVPISSEMVNPDNNGSLIHITGKATTDEFQEDSPFGVRENALKLKRTVTMYQWKEKTSTKTKKNLGGSVTEETTYSYEKTWSEYLINSSGFKKPEGHKNPSFMPYKTEVFTADSVNVGAFKLSSPFISQIDQFATYSLTQEDYNAMDNRLKQSFKLSGNEYFYGDPTNLKIGAMRINYSVITPTEVSVIGKQNNSYIETYFTRNGDIKLLEMGLVGAASMFSSAENENTVTTWLIRLGAFMLMWGGLFMILNPIKVLGDVVPLIGSLLGAGIALVTGIVSLVLGFVAMALAWVFFRPLIGIGLLVMAGAFFFGGFKIIKEKLQKNRNIPKTDPKETIPMQQ